MSLTATTTFEIETCCRCGMQFAVTSEFRQRRRDDHGDFYCPSGHGQHYTGKSDAQKERERADRLSAALDRAERRAANAEENTRIERVSHAATKGQLTKTRKRIANGVCPCCHRSFANVKRHMDSQHPDYAEERS